MMKSLFQISMVASLIILPSAVLADGEFEFDEAFLYQTGQHISTEQFRFGNPIAAGQYVADVYVNGAYRDQLTLRFVDGGSEPIRGLCWSQELMEALELKAEAVVLQPTDSCISALDATPELGYRFDITTHRLSVDVPQIYINARPKGYIPRSSWREGVPAAFLKYSLHGYQQKDDGKRSDHHFASLNTGGSFGRWSFNQLGSASFGENDRYQHQQLYVQRDMDDIDGRLKIGDFYTQSPLIDNISLRGVSLLSEPRMLPYIQNGYAPLIRGHASSPAVIKIYQNDYIIHELSVAAGPFEISDLPALSSTSDTLRVVILEADGVAREMLVPFARTAQMLRPGHMRYHLSAGAYRQNQHTDDNLLVHGSVQYGMNNHLTAQAGTIFHPDYQSVTVGGVTGLAWGALSFDMNAVQAEGWDSASKLHLGYQHYLKSSKTYIDADAYHYVSKAYPSLGDVINTNQPAPQNKHLKQQYRLNVSQDLSKGLGSVYASGTLNRYNDKNESSYQLGYSNAYKNIQYRLGVGKSYNLNTDRYENSWFAHLTMPFDEYLKNPSTISAQHNHRQGSDYSQVSWNSVFGDADQHHYSVGVGKQDHEDASVYASISAGLPAARVGLSASHQGDSSQFSYSASGAVVAHEHGVTLANNLGETFAIIRAKGAKGTPITGGNGNKIDRFGHGIVPTLSPYQINRIGIDVNHLPDDVEIEATAKTLIPRAYTAHLVEFATKSGQLVLFDVNNLDLPPLGSVYDQAGNLIGQVVQDGRVLARVPDSQGQVRVSWQSGECLIDYDIQDESSELVIYSTQCQN